MKSTISMMIAGSLLLLTACSSNSESTNNPTTTNQIAQSAPASDTCKDFPVPLYPSTTSLQCEHSGERYTAYVETADTVEQVTQYYQTKPQESGWQSDPEPLISPEHTVVTIKKGPGHAVISTFTGAGGKGCRFQINAYPNGNP